MSSYKETISSVSQLLASQPTWSAVLPERVARMRAQNRFLTGIDIAKYNAEIMREDMEAYDQDNGAYTRSLGCWHGFIAQQKMIAIKKYFGGSTNKRYLYLSGWMIAAMRSEFGPLPDQSMHEKTAVPALIAEIYSFLKQADARELNTLFRQLDKAQEDGDMPKKKEVLELIENFQTHVVPIIADIDAGYGNEEATYLLAKKMIEAGACCIQIENQVSDAKQCGHQDGKVTVPHEDFLAKITAIRYAFLELGVDQGVIVARTDSLGASLTQKIPVSKTPGDLASQYNSFLETKEVKEGDIKEGDSLLKIDGKLEKVTRLSNGLYRFRDGTNIKRVILDCVTSLKHGADLLWIETPTPNLEFMGDVVEKIRKVVPNAKLVYNNSPSFNWTLNFRQQVFDRWTKEGEDVTSYNREKLMNSEYDNSDLAAEADDLIQQFQESASAQAGVFHHLVTLPTYHTAALSTSELARKYFAEDGMLAYVKGVQRIEIRNGLACAKHQDMAGSGIGDDHKGYFAGDLALKAGGKLNTMNQFECDDAVVIKTKAYTPDADIASLGFVRRGTSSLTKKNVGEA